MKVDKIKKRYIPYPEKEFPVGTVIGIIVLIIVVIAIASVINNYSDSSSYDPAEFVETASPYQVSQSPDGAVALTVDARFRTEIGVSWGVENLPYSGNFYIINSYHFCSSFVRQINGIYLSAMNNYLL